MAAIAAAHAGRRVVVFERLDRPGAKLLASGGGRCNLCNLLAADEFMAAFGRQGRFMQPALTVMDAAALRGFFAKLGVPTISPDNVRVYPASNSAVAVQSALWRRCREMHVDVRLGVTVESLARAGNAFELATSDGPVRCGRVIVAAGGRGYAKLGGSDRGYELARTAGHDIVSPTPALVPLVLADKWLVACAGLSLEDVRLVIDEPGQDKAGRRGELMITHHGLSGPAALDISGPVAELLSRGRRVKLRVDLCAGESAAAWSARLDEWAHKRGARMMRTLLAERLPVRLAVALCEQAGLAADVQAAQVDRAGRDWMVKLIKALPLTVRTTEGFDAAMVTRGGVSLKQVDPKTLQSRVTPGLFFAGEVLDLDGPSGGFNLHWAFASGRLAGESASQE